MAGEWIESTVEREVDIVLGFAFKSAEFAMDPPGHRLVRGDNIKRGSLEWGDKTRFWRTPTPDLSKYMLREGDVVVGMDGSRVGENFARVSGEDLPALLVQRVACLRARQRIDQDFLRYVICNPDFTAYIKAVHTGTSIPHISGGQIGIYPILIPPLSEQRAIAHILSTLDDKIELNRRMNETLEAMALALFKSWFVDFDPVRAKAEGRDPGLPRSLADLFPDTFEDSQLGAIPRGWEVGTLGDFLCQRVERCTASPDTAARPYVPIDCISPKSLFLTESKPGEEARSSLTKFYKGDILFGAMRPYFHKVCIAPFDGSTRTTAFVLYPRRADDFGFATLRLHHPDTIDFATRHSTGSTIPYAIWTDSLDTMPVIAPPSDVRNAFNRLVRPVLVRIPEPYFENRALAALRDTLLPKLMSGELRVENPTQFIGSSD
jgi:type I restriction enzyme S subunit